MKYSIILIVATVLLTSCGSDSGESGSGIVSGTFSDNAVTSFTQTGGLAKSNQEKLLELIIPSAYAASGSYACTQDDVAVFDATVFGSNYVLQVNCASNMDTKIRASLLKTMENKAMLIEISEQGKAQTTFTMPTVSNNKMTFFIENTKALLPPTHPNYLASVADCYSQIVFDLTTGTIVEGVSAATTGFADRCFNGTNYLGDAANDTQVECEGNGNTWTDGTGQNAGCFSHLDDYTTGFSATRHFRFKDGKIEFDFADPPTFSDGGSVDGDGVPTNIDYARWCIDADSNQTCDAI